MRTALTVLGALALLASTSAHAAVTFQQATAITNASAVTDYGNTATSGSGFGTQTRTLSDPGAVLATASAQANSYDDAGIPDASASALEKSRIAFTGAGSGVIDLSGNTAATTTDAASTAEAYSEGQSGSYLFSVDARSVLTISYTYAESFTDPYFYNSLYVGAQDFSSTAYSNSNQGSNTAGTVMVDLDPGSYRLNAYTQIGDDAYASGPADVLGNHNELYQFSIASVSAAPEPASWILMLAGIGGMGAMLRRSRRRGLRVATA